MSRFFLSRLQALEEYVPGEQPRDAEYVKLNTNESPFPPSPGVLAAVNAEAAALLRLYPDPTLRPLKEALAARYDVGAENVFAANGSDDILNFAFLAFGADGVCFPDITYGFYPVFAALHGVDAHQIPLQADFTVDISPYLTNRRMVVLANPNAPTGLTLSPEQIEQIVRTNPDHVVLIDEAYVDFGAQSVCPLTKKYENLLVVQTFSKSRCLAGARLGFAIGNAALIGDLERLRNSTNPYNINRISLAAGVAALEEDDYYTEKCRQIQTVREQTAAALREMGFFTTDSRANFLFARHDAIDGGALYEKLKQRGVLIRHFDLPRIAAYNRITVGSAQQMDIFLNEVREILKGV